MGQAQGPGPSGNGWNWESYWVQIQNHNIQTVTSAVQTLAVSVEGLRTQVSDLIAWRNQMDQRPYKQESIFRGWTGVVLTAVGIGTAIACSGAGMALTIILDVWSKLAH